MANLLNRCYKIAVLDYAAHTADTFRHWSFVVQSGSILEWARNKLSDPVGFERLGYRHNRHSLHAEPMAMRKAYGLLDRRKPWTMINVRLGANKELRMAAPCPLCRAFMLACGCTTCYFSIDETFAKVDLCH